MTLSGYYAFDAQWVKTNGKWSFRLLLADTKTELIIRSKTYTKENEKNINKFTSKTLINQKKIAITTDLKTEYKPIVEKLGFKHQWCLSTQENHLKRHSKNTKRKTKYHLTKKTL
jgi:hypothetical protein